MWMLMRRPFMQLFLKVLGYNNMTLLEQKQVQI
jgi:hypothetical protein